MSFVTSVYRRGEAMVETKHVFTFRLRISTGGALCHILFGHLAQTIWISWSDFIMERRSVGHRWTSQGGLHAKWAGIYMLTHSLKTASPYQWYRRSTKITTFEFFLFVVRQPTSITSRSRSRILSMWKLQSSDSKHWWYKARLQGT